MHKTMTNIRAFAISNTIQLHKKNDSQNYQVKHFNSRTNFVFQTGNWDLRQKILLKSGLWEKRTYSGFYTRLSGRYSDSASKSTKQKATFTPKLRFYFTGRPPQPLLGKQGDPKPPNSFLLCTTRFHPGFAAKGTKGFYSFGQREGLR